MGEKTEAPTSRRLSEARSDGRVAKSQDLAAAIDLFGAFVLILMFGVTVAKAMSTILRRSLTDTGSVYVDSVLDLTRAVAIQTAAAMLPILALICIIAYLAHVSQFGLIFSTKILSPDFSRLNPFQGFGKFFNTRSLAKTLVNLLKLAVVVTIGVLFFKSCIHTLMSLPLYATGAAWAMIGKLATQLTAWLFSVLVTLGGIDYLYQRWQHTKDLRMTKEDVKDERRSMEGDPVVKGKRLKMARQIAMQRINSAVPKADVVVANPTHFSVAIKYDPKTMHAPRVVAKGADEMAMRIREVARTHGVPIVERPPLARALYAAVPVGHEVNPEFYEAVAELLAFVYRLEQDATERSARPAAQAA
ncbi:MAG: flagellar biosynthesis protein FlhB [Planctomycetes bacterium]|nr:flagellar biosynthesis protein FlhB [Planctomycetota bacterium]